MWTSRLLSTLGRHTTRRALSQARRRARHRTLRIETMETRVPLSATSVLAIEPAEATVEPTDDTSDAVLVGEDTAGGDTMGDAETDVAYGDTAVADSSGDGASTVCVPVSTAEQVDTSTEPVTTTDEAVVDTAIQTDPSVWDTDDVDWVDETLVAEIDLSEAEEYVEAPQAGVVTDVAWDSETTETTEPSNATVSPSLAPAPIATGAGTTSIGVGVVPIGQPSPPVIIEFTATPEMSNAWEFEGEVDYATPWDLKIVFGGLLNGHWTTVNNDGSFNYPYTLPSGSNGTVTAQAVTWDGSIYSDIEWVWIS
jgi:hypothetical protein